MTALADCTDVSVTQLGFRFAARDVTFQHSDGVLCILARGDVFKVVGVIVEFVPVFVVYPVPGGALSDESQSNEFMDGSLFFVCITAEGDFVVAVPILLRA